eukprot:5418091-Amphidinium_carterae.1
MGHNATTVSVDASTKHLTNRGVANSLTGVKGGGRSFLDEVLASCNHLSNKNCKDALRTVSYTHLTLPTILLV